MKIEFNSNTVMAIIMFITLLGGGYQYIEGKIEAINKKVDSLVIPGMYDDSVLEDRIIKLEDKDITKEFAVLKQQIADLPIPKDYSEAINDINVQIAKIQTKLEALEAVANPN